MEPGADPRFSEGGSESGVDLEGRCLPEYNSLSIEINNVFLHFGFHNIILDGISFEPHDPLDLFLDGSSSKYSDIACISTKECRLLLNQIIHHMGCFLSVGTYMPGLQ